MAAVNAAGGRAVGLSGVDGGMLRARVKDPALGLVGDVTRVDTTLLEDLLAKGYLPIVSPIGVLEVEEGDAATLLNVNADTVAAAIGAALQADRFVFMTDVPGVCGSDGKLLDSLSREQALGLMQSGVISGGMIPKVEACLMALENVHSSLILDGRRPHALRASCSGERVGTTIE